MPKEVNYAALSNELDAIMAKLQADGLDVDEALKLYERGLEVVKQLENYLKTAENKVTKLKAKFSQ